MKKSLSIVIAFIAGTASALVLPRFAAEPPAASKAAAKEQTVDSRAVTLTPELARRARIKSEAIEKTHLEKTLRLVGSVNFDLDALSDVGARIDGRVARVLISVGDRVRAGDPLIEVDSAEIGEATAAYLRSRANLVAAEQSEARESALLIEKLSSAAVVERARAEVRALRAEQQGAEQRLLTMGFSAADLTQLARGERLKRITLRAPIAGRVIARNAVIGQVVGPTSTIVRIADLDRLWVELDVFERDLGRVALGNAVEIESESHPDHTFRGRVTFVDATVDMATRTAHVRVEVDNEQRLLRPGQFVHARLVTATEDKELVTVPRSAILQIEGEPSVFIAADNNRYVARPVELGAQAGDRVAIVRGVLPEDRVVTEGAFALKSELLR